MEQVSLGIKQAVFRTLVLQALLLSALPLLGAERVLGWSFDPAGGKENPVAPAVFVQGVSSPSGIEVRPGMGRGSKKGAFGGNNCHDATTFVDAAATDQAIAFTLETSPAHALTLTQIAPCRYSRSSTGATTGRWQYSLQGAPFVDLGADLAWSGSGGTAPAVDLSSLPPIGPGSNVTFRLVLWGATRSTGTWYIMADEAAAEYFSLEGTVETVGVVLPTPPSIAALENGLCYEKGRFESPLKVLEADGDAVTTNAVTAVPIRGRYGIEAGLFFYEPAVGDAALGPVPFEITVSDKDGSASTSFQVAVHPFADWLETFDRASQGTYAKEMTSMTADRGPWLVTNLTVKAPVKSDWVFTGKSVRTQGLKSSFYMDFDKANGLSEISLYHGMAEGSPSLEVSWTLSVSRDGGNSWNAFVSEPQVPGETEFVKTTFPGLKLSGNIRIRIDVSAPAEDVHVNFDQIAMMDYVTQNAAPAISATPSSAMVEPGATVEINVAASDPDGDPLSLAVTSEELPDAASSFTSVEGTNGLFRFTPGPGDVGKTFHLLFSADDGTDCSYAPAEITVEPLWAIDFDFAHVVTENFDGLGSEREAILPRGWKIATEGPTRALGSFDRAGRMTEKLGGANMSSRANAGAYNFGAGDEATAVDRAAGFLGSGNVGSGNLMVRLRNKAVSPMKSFEVSYDVEKYRNGSNAAGFLVALFASTDGISWTQCGQELVIRTVADADSNGHAEVPSVTRSVTGTFKQTVPCGGDLYLAWLYSAAEGSSSSSAQALAIDNVVIRARPAKTTILTIR